MRRIKVIATLFQREMISQLKGMGKQTSYSETRREKPAAPFPTPQEGEEDKAM